MPVDISFSLGDTLDIIANEFPTSNPLDRFPEKRADAEKLLVKVMNRLVSVRRGNQASHRNDPVNTYNTFFEGSASNTRCLHPIGWESFAGFDEDYTDLAAAEDDNAPSAPSNIMGTPVDPMAPPWTPHGPRSKKGSEMSDEQRDEEEFERLLRETAKESIDAVKQASTLKAMSGRRTNVNVAPQLMQLQDMLRSPSYANTLGVASQDRKAVSLGIVMRNKEVAPAGAAGRRSGGAPGPTVLVRSVDVPSDDIIVQTQKANIHQFRLEEKIHKSVVLSRVQQMQREEQLEADTSKGGY